MKKIFPLFFVLVLLLVWSIAWADDGRRARQKQEIQEKLAAEQERQAQLRSLARAVMPEGHEVSTAGRGFEADVLVDCPPGGVPEGEPQCGPDYVDDYNSGCNALSYDPPLDPVFTAISCGDTICGTSGVFSFDGSTHRDTDWYRLELTEPADVEYGGTAEFPLQLLLMDAGLEDCETDETIDFGSVPAEDTLRLGGRLLPGVYWLWAGPDDWYTDLWCDGNGPLGNDYVIWVTCTPTPPCNPEVVIGDINSQLPYRDMAQTTCGKGNDWDNTCLGFWDGGEDIVYEFTVSEMVVLDITLDPHDSPWTGIAIDDFCPLDESECRAFAWQTSTPAPYGIQGFIAMPGTYWIMVDTWPDPTCIPEFDLTIAEGPLAYALAETDNIPDCAISNIGALGKNTVQQNTYNWSDSGAANYEAGFVMGNSPTTMFAEYGQGPGYAGDCYQYRGVLGIDISDPFHPTCRYDDNDVLGGVSIEYCGDGFTTPPEAGDIFVHSFTITNNSGQTITDYYAGVHFDWDIDYPDQDTVILDRSRNLIYQGRTDFSYLMGLCLINADQVNLRTLTGVSQSDYIYDQQGWLMEDLYALMSADGDFIADSFYTDMSSLLSTGPHTLEPGQSVTIQIAIIGASSVADMEARAEYAATLDIPPCTVEIPVGACCDDLTGECQDNVLRTECPYMSRFVPDTQCADLDPACGETGGCDYICGDVNGNGAVNVVDITALVLYLTAGNLPGCPCDCLTPPFYACADVNGNCGINVVDITALVLYLTAGQPPSTCVDCPSTNPCPPGLTLPEGGGAPTLITPNKVKTVKRSN